MGRECGRAPLLEARKDSRRLKLPCPTGLLPVRPKLIHPRIAHRIITERVAPALSNRSLEQLFVRPFQEAQPEKLPFAWMLSRIGRCVFQKAWTALLKYGGKRVRHGAGGLDAKPEPIGKRSPLKKFGNSLVEKVTRDQSGFVLRNLLRPPPQSNFSRPLFRDKLHRDSSEPGRQRVSAILTPPA
jgi:hypothetical protein